MGHSLGGGIAALMTLIYHSEGLPVQGYTYAAPPCVSRELAESSESFIHSFSLHNDIVPRLSHKSMMRLRRSIEDIVFTKKNTQQGLLRTALFTLMNNAIPSSMTRDELYVPGTVYCMEYSNSKGVKDSYKIYKDRREVLSHVKISKNMITDHFLDGNYY